MLLTDSPELAHLPEDQAYSAESSIAPILSKIVCLKQIPITETIRRGTGSRNIHIFLHNLDSWIDILLVGHLLVKHPLVAGFY